MVAIQVKPDAEYIEHPPPKDDGGEPARDLLNKELDKNNGR